MSEENKEQEDESKEEKGTKRSLTQIPLTRVKRIIKSDPDVKLISTDACFVVTKATVIFNFLSPEHFVHFNTSSFCLKFLGIIC
jgi:hypothetical protein